MNAMTMTGHPLRALAVVALLSGATACGTKSTSVGEPAAAPAPVATPASAPDSAAAPALAPGTAVAILVAAHRSYTFHMEGTNEPDIFAAEKRGYATLLGALGEADRAAAWVYDEKGIEPVAGWGAPGAAVPAVEAIAPDDVANPESPHFYDAIAAVLRDIGAHADSLPKRRVLVVVSDAKDSRLDYPEEMGPRVAEVAALAASAGVTIQALGFTLDVDEPLAYLKSLAEKTGGSYRDVSGDATEAALAREIAAVGRTLTTP